MKKYLLYILIIITLVGTLSPLKLVRAESGTCVTTNKVTRVATQQSMDRSACNTANPPAGFDVSFIPSNAIPLTPNPNAIAPAQTQAAPDKTYHLLAPLPCDSGTPGCTEKGLETFDPTGDNKIGGYLNVMLKIFIGICAVLAVIMIVIGGMEYMTSELISNKEHGREKIRDAILGLLLALGAYTLLFTINPNLLNTDLKTLSTQEITVTLAEETETVGSAVTGGDVFTGATPSCSEGIKQSNSGIYVCARLADKLDQMINAAKGSGINLTGGGYRSPDAQRALRIQNCAGDTTNPSAPCNPPTAIPGASRHNNGLAIDFRCDGTLIQTTDNKCFLWLKSNASNYGLFNLPSEPWHWSIDGR